MKLFNIDLKFSPKVLEEQNKTNSFYHQENSLFKNILEEAISFKQNNEDFKPVNTSEKISKEIEQPPKIESEKEKKSIKNQEVLGSQNSKEQPQSSSIENEQKKEIQTPHTNPSSNHIQNNDRIIKKQNLQTEASLRNRNPSNQVVSNLQNITTKTEENKKEIKEIKDITGISAFLNITKQVEVFNKQTIIDKSAFKITTSQEINKNSFVIHPEQLRPSKKDLFPSSFEVKQKKNTKQLLEETFFAQPKKEDKNIKNTSNPKPTSQEILTENKNEIKNQQQNFSKIEVYVKPELKLKEGLSKQPSFAHKEHSDRPFDQNFYFSNINTKNFVKNDVNPIFQEKLQESIKSALEEIISKAKIQLGKDHFNAQIRLNPAIFGFMSVDMRYENGSMILKILVDNQEVFKKLQDNSESIKFEFAKQGINVDNLEIKFKETESFANRNFQENHFAFDFNGSNQNQRDNLYLEQNQNDFFVGDILKDQEDRNPTQEIGNNLRDSFEYHRDDEDFTYNKVLSMNTKQKKEYWG